MMNKFIRLTVLTSTLLLGSRGVQAQYITPHNSLLDSKYFSVGATLGMADMWADVGTSRMPDHYASKVDWQNVHFMGGVFGRYMVNKGFSARLGINYGSLYASDAFNKRLVDKNIDHRELAYLLYCRNQEVRTKIFDANIVAQVMPFKFIERTENWLIQPVIELGVGVFHFNSQGSYFDSATGSKKWVDLQPLHLEGEGLGYAGAPKGYKLWQMSIPMGIGLHYSASDRIDLDLEYLYRYTFTDYLDGVSQGAYVNPKIFDEYLSAENAGIAKQMYDKIDQIDPTSKSIDYTRGNPRKKDAYTSFSISVSYKLFNKHD